MSYIGLRPTTQTLATASQILSGDGSTRSFALQQPVGKASDIVVSVARELQIPEVDYTANGTELLFAVGRAPANASNNIAIAFLSGALNTIYLTANSFVAGTTVNPSINSTGALTTGIYWPTTSRLGFTVSGNTRIVVSDDSLGVATSTTTGALRVTGGVGITGDAFIGGQLNLLSGLNATSQVDGALVIDGGLGASGDFFLGGTMTISGGLTVAGAFNTTATNSLTVNTPFIFLANTNVGDAIDQGLVGTYNDGFTQRYTGIYRAQADGAWKLFTNLDNEPTTLVDSGNVSFRYADLWLANANVTATTQSTTVTTGALTTSGGVGIAKNLYIGGGIGAGGSLGTNGQFLQSTGTGLTWSTLSASRINQDASNVTVTTSYVNVAVNGTNVASFGATQMISSQTIIPAGNASITLGTLANQWSTVFAKATSAQYADLAENYASDAIYEPGTVVCFDGEAEITQCNTDMCVKVAGVVSTNPAYLMNSTLINEKTLAIALTGRVPCKVTGLIAKGDMLVSAGNGNARAEENPKLGSVIGKSLENFDGLEGVIEVVVGRL
jgi:hypothetical protein